jgi:hypothetical protein
MTEPSPPDDLAEEARFVFRGTVQRVHASLMSEVPASEQTCIIRVDEVLQSPQSLAQSAGQRVTVLLPETGSVARGEQAVFFTNPWLYGATLAVQAVAHRGVPATMVALAHQPSDPVRTLVRRDRQARFAGADLVVRGVVTVVRLIEPAAVTPAPSRRDEHDPMWQEAVVRVTAVEQGTDPGPEVIVRFPASLEVAWRDAPKFHPGQEGRFILRQLSAATDTSDVATGTGTQFYTALHRHDFQAAQELLEEDLQSAEPTR